MGSRRLVVRRGGVRLVASLGALGLAIGACGGSPAAPSPATGQSGPTQTVLGQSAAPGSSAIAAPSGVGPGPMASTTATASPSAGPSPSAVAAGWRTVTDTTMVYGGFGIAGNGDLIAIAAPFDAPAGKGYDIIRADPATGAVLSRAPLDPRMDTSQWFPVYVDPTSDNVITHIWTGTYLALATLDSTTGKIVKQTKPAVSANLVAVDRQGRMYANTIPIDPARESPELLVRLGPDGKVAARLDVKVTHRDQLDDPGKLAFGYFNFERIVTYYGWTLALAVSPDGTIQSLQIPGSLGQSEPKDKPYFDTFDPDFTHLRRATLPLEWPGGSPRWIFWESMMLAMAADDAGTLYLVEAIGPSSGKEPEWDGATRLRAIGSDGKALATWGAGGDSSGLDNPQRVGMDGSGRAWVVDLDPKTKRQSVKVLEPAP